MIRCYKSWAEPASKEDADKLHGQCRLGGDYRHALVEIENRGRALLRALWAQPMRDIPIDDRKAWREAGGDKVIKAWTATDEYKDWRSKIQKETWSANKVAYGISGDAGLAWGTRLAVGEAVDHARRTTAWVDDLGNAAVNRVAVQIQITKPLSGLAVMDGEDTRFQIGRIPYALGPRVDGFRARAAGEVRNRGGNVRPMRLREAKLRIGSDGRAPIWASLHVLLHRPIPDGQIKGAWAQRRSVGGRWEWELVVSIDLGDAPAKTHPRQRETCAVDLGWRRRDDGMRLAYWVASDDKEGEIVIPIDVERRKAKSDDLRSIRDKRRNEFLASLLAWVKENPGTWLDEAVRHAALWTRMIHFIRLERTWRDQLAISAASSMDADPETQGLLRHAELVAFLKQDRHLHAWQAHNLVKMQRQIRGRLDAVAHELCARYGVVVIESIQLTKLKEMEDVARINAKAIQRLAPGEMLRAIRQAASKYGTIVQELDPAYTTLECSACGHRREVADQSKLVLTCDACGHADDQDRTAAHNLLRASGLLRDMDGRPLDPKETKKTAKKLAPRRMRKRVIEAAVATLET